MIQRQSIRISRLERQICHLRQQLDLEEAPSFRGSDSESEFENCGEHADTRASEASVSRYAEFEPEFDDWNEHPNPQKQDGAEEDYSRFKSTRRSWPSQQGHVNQASSDEALCQEIANRLTGGEIRQPSRSCHVPNCWIDGPSSAVAPRTARYSWNYRLPRRARAGCQGRRSDPRTHGSPCRCWNSKRARWW